MKIGSDLLVIIISAIVVGFALGMIVAGHSNWECIGERAIC